MDQNGQTVPDIRDYPANRNKFPVEELAKYAGQYIAFSLDGKHLMASGANTDMLVQELLRQNIPLDQVVIDHLDGENDEEAWEIPSFYRQEWEQEKSNPPLPPPDLRHYSENRRHFPLEELAKYAGLYVAFSPDGKSILASGPNRLALHQELRKRGIHPSQVVHSYIDPL
jgi:hypothetical protein